MKHLKKHGARFISFVLTLLIVVSLIPAGTVFVSAATNFYYKVNSNYVDASNYNYVATFEQAWNEAKKYNNGAVGTLTDVSLSSTLSTTSNYSLTLELNGHKINRGRITSSAETDYNAFSVSQGSTLVVYGGTKSSPQPTGTKTFTYYNSSGSAMSGSVTNKGLITGGRNTHNGGGINVEKNATLNLYYTAVSGNRADDSGTTIGGYGGGIALRGDYAKLNMHNSEVSYNYAEFGGGICARDSAYATITMENSKVNNNTATEEGGGISNSGNSENFKIQGDADADTIDKSSIHDNTSSKKGGGIYFDCENSVVSGMYIHDNQAGTDAGGVYLPKEKCNIRNCRIVANDANGGMGGGIYNDNDNNTIEDTTVYNNNASGNGKGIYNYGNGNIAMSGKCVVKGNSTQNLYLDYNSLQDEHYIDNSLSKGSEVYITYGLGHPARLTKKAGTYDDSFFYSDTNNYYFKWFPRDSTEAHNDRNIYRVSGTKPAKASATTISQRTSSTSFTYQNQPVIKGIFEFPASVDDTIDREAAFYYSDGYFKDSAKTYNTHLATLSANMVMAAMYSSVGGSGSDSAEYRDKSNNIRQMMSDIGCKDEDIYVNDFNVRRPTTKTIGVCIASKDLPDGEKLVIIGVRGGGYEAEWASNVSIGSTGEANGFRDAADTVFAELNSYLSRRNINASDSKTKYWVAGYSRAGATANLTAKRIVDAYDTGGTRTFAYPIEAPKGALKSEANLTNASGKYACIHNVLNFCDLVPWVAPAGMGFTRYGVDHYVPGAASAGTPYSTSYATVADNSFYNVGDSNYQSQKSKMLTQLAAMNDDIVYDDYFHMATIKYVEGVIKSDFIAESSESHSGSTNMSVEDWIPKFWSAFQGWGFDYNDNASATSGTGKDKQVTINNGNTIRTNYSTTVVKGSKSFQTALAYVMNMVFSMEPEKKEKIMSCTDGLIDRIGITTLLGIYTNFINKTFSGMIGSSDFDTTVEKIWTALTELSTEDEAKGYHSLKEYLSTDELEELHQALPALVYPILEFVSKDYENYGQDHVGTLAYNAMRLIQNHYPEVATAWVRSYDSYYDNDTTPVTLAVGTGGKEAPRYPAVEVESVTGGITTYNGTTSTITVDMADKIRLVPNDSSYKDKGEAIYYCYPKAKSSDCRGWHGYADPIVFKNLDASTYSNTGSGSNTFTIDTFSAHYDMAADGTKTMGKTSAFDATKRTYNFNVIKTYASGKYYAALKNVALTGNMRTDIVNIAKSQNGYMEGNNSNELSGESTTGSSNYTEYGRWYGLQDMWCAMFVSWCANQAGVSTSVIPKTASTVTALNYFINQGVAHTRASVAAGNYTPQAGDIIFFKSGRNSAITNHIGIVTSYSGTTINTIEGNTSSATVSTNGGCVRAKSYSITNTYIVYVCRPKYPTDNVVSSNVEFDGAKYDYRSWPNADTRWGDKVIGTGSATVGNSSGITTAVVKLSIQAGIHTASGYSVSDFVYTMNQNNGYTAAGAMYWDVAKTTAGFDGVEANLMSESSDGVSFESEKQQIINWILAGKHLALYVADSKGVKSWVAVDEAMTLATGEIYIMDATAKLSENANVKASDKYANLRRVAGFTGGQIAYELIGSDDYRIWRKIDDRWKNTNLGNYKVWADNDQGKGDLIIASAKLAIQAELKNPQLYNINNAIADTKKGSNGGFSSEGNMYWADAAQALGFDGYNANLLASGSYSSTDYYENIKSYINAGKHLVIFVNNTWVAVDEAQTLEKGAIWVWRSNIDAVSGGQKTGDNICALTTIADSFTRVACFTGGKTKTNHEQYVYLPGTFNGWKEDRPMTKRSDGKYEKVIYLPAGSYEFKIIDDGYWHGNQATINNSNSSDNNGYGWEFPGEDYGGNHNCTLNAQGGYYTFVYAAGGYSDHPYHLVISYSTTPPQQGEVAPVIDSGAEDYRKWNITDTRWSDSSLNKTDTAVMSNAAAGYGDLYVAAAKMMIATGKATPDTIDPGKLAAQTRVTSNTGVFDWDDFARVSGLTKVNKALLSGTYETRLGGRTAENTGKTLKQYILDNHYHLFIKIDEFSGGYGWALVDEAMTASATGDEIYVWLSKSTNSKSTNDNPVLLSSIATEFKQVAAYSGGNSIVKVNFSGDNDSEVTAEYTYNAMTAEINSGDYVPNGSSVTITGKPATGYEYDEWTHNLSTSDDKPTTTSAALKYTATSDKTIAYKTKSKSGTITYSEESRFTYAAGKPTTKAAGESVSFTIIPDSDYVATVFVEKSNGDVVSFTKSSNTYTFTMPGGDVNVSVEMNYEDYRTWSKSDSRWADTKLGTSSYMVSDTVAGMGDLVVAVAKLSKQSGSGVVDVSDAVSKLNSGGGLGTTGYLDWAGTTSSGLGFNSYHRFDSSGSSSAKASEIAAGINDGKHYVIKISNSLGWVAVDETLTKLTGEIYVMLSGDNPDENADIRLSDISPTFSNYAYFTGGTTPSVTERTITFSGSSHIAVTASYSIGSKSYSIKSGDKVHDGMTVRFRATAEPSYEFENWTCTGVTPDDKDAAELVATATANINVTCSEKEKDSVDTNVPLRIKYCYKDYDPMLSDTFEYMEGNEFLSEKTVYSKSEYTISAANLTDPATLRQKVLAGMPKLNSDYFNYSRTISADEDFTDATEYDYNVDAYVVSVEMTPTLRTYTLRVNSTETTHHFQDNVYLKAADYNVSDAVWVNTNNGVNNVVAVGDTYRITVTGDMNITVREKTEGDPDSVLGQSIVVPAFTTITTDDGVEKCNQNFYIQNHIGFVESSKTLIGAGVFYYVYDDVNDAPVKSAITKNDAVNHLEEYALGFENKKTSKGSKHLYKNKETGLSYSYHNYAQDSALNYNDRILRNPYGSDYVHYLLELSLVNEPSNAAKYSYRVYSFYLYSEGGVTYAVISDPYAEAKVFSASE